MTIRAQSPVKQARSVIGFQCELEIQYTTMYSAVFFSDALSKDIPVESFTGCLERGGCQYNPEDSTRSQDRTLIRSALAEANVDTAPKTTICVHFHVPSLFLWDYAY